MGEVVPLTEEPPESLPSRSDREEEKEAGKIG
jgi:hypothetical protein